MTYRSSDTSSKDCISQPESRLNQRIRREATDEGCPVIEESGTVCGETSSLSIFNEFRNIYDDFLKCLEQNDDGSSKLVRLAPVKKLLEDLWEQNVMLVETVEELEQEAACTVTNLQDRLNKSCQKELHCMLKTKEREVDCLTKTLAERDELLKEHCSQIENLKGEIKLKNKKYREILRQLKCAARKENTTHCEDDGGIDLDELDVGKLQEWFDSFLKNLIEQRTLVFQRFQDAESQLKTLATEKKMYLIEKSEIKNQLMSLKAENERLVKEMADEKSESYERKELFKRINELENEKKELTDRISHLEESTEKLKCNFKEARWALTSEVAEKHDKVQELKRCVVVLEEQLRQANMQTQFKDDIIKELRKELKSLRKSERQGLYDVVNELREQKTRDVCTSAVTFDCDTPRSTMNSSQTGAKCPEVGYFSATSLSEEKDQETRTGSSKNASDNAKLQSELQCLKKSLKIRVEQLREQDEFTRELEEELSRTKMDLAAVQEKCERLERRCKSLGVSSVSSVSEPGLSCQFTALSCAIGKVEEILMAMSGKHGCGISISKAEVEQELEKIRMVKNDLKTHQKHKPKIQSKECIDEVSTNKFPSCGNLGFGSHSVSNFQSYRCDLIHLDDVEIFREKAVSGVVALEQMKEQIDILENIVGKYIEQFPCECDRGQVKACEDKLERLRDEFDNVTDQLCSLLQKVSKPYGNESFNTCIESVNSTSESFDTQISCPIGGINRPKIECHKLQKEFCDKENKAEKLKSLALQLDEEIQTKRNQLEKHNKELDERICEIIKLRELVSAVGFRLRQLLSGHKKYAEHEKNLSNITGTPNLATLFCDLQEFWFILKKSSETLIDVPVKLKEDNEKLKEKLCCLEKCISNKEETLRVVQDTVKLRECQIEELKFRMQTSESQTFKLTQDVEEKCRLIANLQEAVRKCKQFETDVMSPQVELLEFEVCELDEKLKNTEKEVLLRDQKLESLYNDITLLSSKNFILSQEMKIVEPRLKSLYKTCHLFEKMVNELQKELHSRECEVESLYDKIKELEGELEDEFKKCENRAAEDAKYIEELSSTLKNFQNELCCSQEKYSKSVAETEHQLKNEREMNKLKESELNTTIRRLQAEIKELQCRTKAEKVGSAAKISDLENLIKEAENRHQCFNEKISELQKVLECTVLEHEEERKNILQKLCEEKRENLKNKTLITKLNENIKQAQLNESTLKEFIQHFNEENESLKIENQELRTEVEARKKIMCEMERNDDVDLSEIEKLICHLKIQKADFKSRCCNLKMELDKEIKMKKLLECRVKDLSAMLENKMQEFNQLIDNYKCTTSKVQQALMSMEEAEKNFTTENNFKENLTSCSEIDQCNRLKKLLDMKTAESAKHLGQLQMLKIEFESMQTENALILANKDSLISQLRHDVICLENNIQQMQSKQQKLADENKSLQAELGQWEDKEASMQSEFKKEHKELCMKLRETLNEKNDLLISLDELQKQLEQICLENVHKEKIDENEPNEVCSRQELNDQPMESHLRNKSDKIICNLSKEVKTLHCELSAMKKNYDVMSVEYQSLLEQMKCCEKKKLNLERLYVEVCNENKKLQELRMQNEAQLCEVKSQNALLKEKLCSKGHSFKNSEERKRLGEKVREMTLKIKTLENRVIPELEREIAEKNCTIENLKADLNEANISSQRMRNEALRVINYTKRYLSAQKCANESLKSRLECSNKRGNILGAENRELEEQLKAVTRMNEFLLCQLESNRNDASDAEPRSFSPLPWGCSTVERDTSSSEYLAESGFQSMQPSPTNMEFMDDYRLDSKRTSPSPWSSLKKNKCGGSVECSPCRNSVR